MTTVRDPVDVLRRRAVPAQRHERRRRPVQPPDDVVFSTTATLYKVIQKLAALRAKNPALRYGTSTQRWINNDVYIYERKFYGDAVLVAINKTTSTGYSITGLNTALPAGTYSDLLTALMGGGTITVSTARAATTQ